MLNAIINSEYNNAVELMGLEGGEVNMELMGYLNSLDAVSRSRAVSKLTKKNIPSSGSRAEFEKFFSELPKHIKEGLLSGKLRLADEIIYSMKFISGARTIKMFKSEDVKETSLRNLTAGKLPKNSALLVSGIYLLHGIGVGNTQEDLKAIDYDSIKALPVLANGEFRLKANKIQLIPDTSCRKFVTDNFNAVPIGYYKLHNPRLIHDDVDIEFEIELGSLSGINANAAIYVGLHGTMTTP